MLGCAHTSRCNSASVTHPHFPLPRSLSEIWVSVKAKTTDKRSRQVTKRRWGFKASKAGVVLGSAPHTNISSITVDDASLSAEHARIALSDTGDVVIIPAGRTYLLIGQGARSAGLFQLSKDHVIKMGACSLQVTDVCYAASESGVCVPPAHQLSAERARRAAAAASHRLGRVNSDASPPFDSESAAGAAMVNERTAAAMADSKSVLVAEKMVL